MSLFTYFSPLKLPLARAPPKLKVINANQLIDAHIQEYHLIFKANTSSKFIKENYGEQYRYNP